MAESPAGRRLDITGLCTIQHGMSAVIALSVTTRGHSATSCIVGLGIDPYQWIIWDFIWYLEYSVVCYQTNCPFRENKCELASGWGWGGGGGGGACCWGGLQCGA